jgi:hypothetical protein
MTLIVKEKPIENKKLLKITQDDQRITINVIKQSNLKKKNSKRDNNNNNAPKKSVKISSEISESIPPKYDNLQVKKQKLVVLKYLSNQINIDSTESLNNDPTLSCCFSLRSNPDSSSSSSRSSSSYTLVNKELNSSSAEKRNLISRTRSLIGNCANCCSNVKPSSTVTKCDKTSQTEDSVLRDMGVNTDLSLLNSSALFSTEKITPRHIMFSPTSESSLSVIYFQNMSALTLTRDRESSSFSSQNSSPLNNKENAMFFRRNFRPVKTAILNENKNFAHHQPLAKEKPIDFSNLRKKQCLIPESQIGLIPIKLNLTTISKFNSEENMAKNMRNNYTSSSFSTSDSSRSSSNRRKIKEIENDLALRRKIEKVAAKPFSSKTNNFIPISSQNPQLIRMKLNTKINNQTQEKFNPKSKYTGNLKREIQTSTDNYLEARLHEFGEQRSHSAIYENKEKIKNVNRFYSDNHNLTSSLSNGSKSNVIINEKMIIF